MIFALCTILTGSAFVVTMAIWGISRERRQFNNGRCPICGEELYLFGMNSYGERGYACMRDSYKTWVSWNSVDHFCDRKRRKDKME